MKWLVQTLDSLTSNRSDNEALTEQRHLEQLITRYKNLIPTIEITMTKTDIYSKSYTYRKEVREVCTLLHRVCDQMKTEVPTVKNFECLKDAVKHQESRLSQLEQQRANIVSMLQRGKDILKDQHAPTFISSEVQQLETSWNETYGQNIEALKNLKSSQKLWNTYEQQKNEILKLIAQAEDELKRVRSTSYYDVAQVSTDLHGHQELSSFLRKAAVDMIRNLHTTRADLSDVAGSGKQPDLKEEVTVTEHKLQTTLEKVEESVTYLQELNTRWNKFQSQLRDLQNWTRQNASHSMADIQDSATSPDERVRKTEILQKQIHEKITILEILEKETRYLVKGLFSF